MIRNYGSWLRSTPARAPVYFADEDALYFATLPLPCVDRSPSVEADPRELSAASSLFAHDQPSFQVWAVSLAANGA